MCIGIPMRVLSVDGLQAVCARRNGATQSIDLSLVGPQQPGQWLLVFIDAARSLLTEEEAIQVDDALQAVEAVMRGEDVDHLFADLVGREPELPDFLKAKA